MRGIGWFSGGVTSAVAIKMALDFGHDVDIYYFETNQHHPDHARFLKDCENWYGQRIHIIHNKKAKSVHDILRKGFINSPNGAYCTHLLKKKMRVELEKIVPYDFQIFGFEYEKKQINRAIRFEEQYPEAKAVFPLIELKLDKKQAMIELQNAGIELPMMYKLGYSNSNCIGCVKGGMGYWNKIRVDFPDVFNEVAKIERQVKRTCIKGKYLDELDPQAGRHEELSLPECGVVCPVELDGLKFLDNADLIQNKLFIAEEK